MVSCFFPFVTFLRALSSVVFWDRANCGLRLGRHFNGEESFDTGPMAPATEQPVVASSSNLERSKSETKL